jgi:putative MATE family efflux protein
MAYQLVDLYFVVRVGKAAVAGVSAAGSAMIIVMALAQMLNAGSAALVAHAVGRKDQVDANVVFNQSLTLSMVSGVLVIGVIAGLMHPYLQSVAADAATISAGITFTLWMMPCFALLFPMTVVGAALRSTGVVQPMIVIQILTVVINAILAPILISGWGTGLPLGVMGVGLASSIAVTVGLILLGMYLQRSDLYVKVQWQLLRPQFKHWRRILLIGLPAGGELWVQFLFVSVVYYTIRNFGVSAQAGFGIGSRILQAMLLPAMAIAFSAGPIAGQNFGAMNSGRVKETFRKVVLISSAVMIAITIFAQWRPQALVGMFDADVATLAIAALFLQTISWNFVAQGLLYSCSNMFQAMGNTTPSLISSGAGLFVFTAPAIWLSTLPGFRIEHIWYLSIAATTFQVGVSLFLLRIEYQKRLMPATL